MSDCGISKLDLKRRNRMQILRVVRECGPISRVDISSILQITRAAVTIITNEMIEQRILEEVGEEASDPGAAVHKGRRKILLDINETFRFAIGIYVDEQELSIGLTTMNSAVMDKVNVPHNGMLTVQQVLEIVQKSVGTMLQNSCLTMDDVLGIGVGVMPSMYDAMGGELSDGGAMLFPALQTLLEECFGLPVCAENAVLQMALAGVTFKEKHGEAACQVLLYWDGEKYTAIPAYGITRGKDYMLPETDLSNLSVTPDGKQLEGYSCGSVYAELSQESVRGAVTSTPDVSLSAQTLASVLTAMEHDAVPPKKAEVILQKFCLMLNNLYTLYHAKYLCLYGFGFSNENMRLLRQYAAAFGGEDFAKSIVDSPIQEKYRFLCGSTYAIQNGFYQRGGILSV